MRKINVLLIEDDKEWAYFFTDFLKENNIIVGAVTTNMEEIIQQLSKNKYDFILVDMHLHEDKNGGLKIIQQISKKTDAYIIVISADRIGNISYEAMSAGAIGYEKKSDYWNIPNIFEEVLDGTYIQMHIAMGIQMKTLSQTENDISLDMFENKDISYVATKRNMDKSSVYKAYNRAKSKLKISIDFFRKFYKR
jgi:response regulator of citrate/malate metabolism